MDFKKYVNEMLDIAKENNMPWDIGVDMFIANIQNAGGEGLPYYPGADHVEYGELQKEWKELDINKKHETKRDVMKFIRDNMKKIIEERRTRK